jgi:pSer/pThr/pTyr-binding forkhead associated (FHA) protein
MQEEVVMVIEGGPRIVLEQGRTYLVGRGEFDSGANPAIDLGGVPFGKTVSRQHASMYVADDIIMLTDLRSRNRTRRNEFLLVPDQAYPVGDGDELKFGEVAVFISSPRGRKD